MRFPQIVCAAVCFAASAFALPITFVHSGSGSGTIGATVFSDADFSITAFGDTTNRMSFGSGFFIDHNSAFITIDGLGVFAITTGTRTFVNTGSPIVGFSRAGSDGTDLLNGPIDASLATWDMLSAIGPLMGPGNLLQWSSPVVLTDGGTLWFADGGTTVTFLASLDGPLPDGEPAPVPESGTLTLLALGIGGLVLHRIGRRGSGSAAQKASTMDSR